jgi:hypothetical protein
MLKFKLNKIQRTKFFVKENRESIRRLYIYIYQHGIFKFNLLFDKYVLKLPCTMTSTFINWVLPHATLSSSSFHAFSSS